MSTEYHYGPTVQGTARYAVVDACIAGGLRGNPAAVMLLADELPSEDLLRLAQELDEPVTAFVVKRAEPHNYDIRWFTRSSELRICGHATLAASEWVLTGPDEGQQVTWHSKAGALTASRERDKVTVDFPQTKLQRMDFATAEELAAAIGKRPKECFIAGDDYLAVLDASAAVIEFKPEVAAIESLPCRGVILSAEYQSQKTEAAYHIVSRFFAPRIAIPEDEVCVSAHCALYPLWKERNGYQTIKARQASPRGGALMLTSHRLGRVSVTGACRLRTNGTWLLR
jgi:PhzF family phenazine biosynthesis protein